MIVVLEAILPMVFAFSAMLYIGLAVFVARSSPQSIMGLFLFLAGVLVAGSAFSYTATDPSLYGIGRTLSFFASSFIPVAFYSLYRQYTERPARAAMILVLSIIPIATTLLAITNSMHNMIWSMVDTPDGLRFSAITSHWWFNRVHAPYAYGLFGLSLLGLAGKLSTIAPAHRSRMIVLLVCAVLPFAASSVNTFFGAGPIDFPVLASSLVLLLPVYAYIGLTLRVFEFSPLAYSMLFDHVRDPIFVLDNEQRIACVNRSATELLGYAERDLLGQRLWDDIPEARKVLQRARELDLTQTLRLDSDCTYEVSVAPLADGHGIVRGSVVVCRDVTERRNALAQLAESEHQIRTLIETSSNGILRFSRDQREADGQFRCVFANRAAEGFLLGDHDGLIGTPIGELIQLDPDRLLQHFQGNEPATDYISFEVAANVSDEDAWFRVVGEPVGEDFSVTLIDITQRPADGGSQSARFRKGCPRGDPTPRAWRRRLPGPEPVQVNQ